MRYRPNTILGEATRLTLLVLSYALFVILLLILVATFAGPIPIPWVWFSIALIGGGGAFVLLLFLKRPRVEGLKSNKTEDWVRAAGLLAIVFVLGQTLLALSSFYSQTVTQSRCIDPPAANVTSSNCKAIQTVTIPQTNVFGNYGALTLELALTFVILLLGLSGLLYILSRSNLRSSS